VARLEIVTGDAAVLRERAREVAPDELASAPVQQLIDDMIETMRAASGAGLAANQVGERARIAVVGLTVVVNPVLEVLGDERFDINEGCLSLPDVRGVVARAVDVRMRYVDRDGAPHDELRRGLTAGTFQHELDHLDGVLFVDRVADPATLTTWDEFERDHRAAFEARARALVARVGS